MSDREAEVSDETSDGPRESGPDGPVGRTAVKPTAAVTPRRVDAGEGTSVRVLVGPDDGAPNFVLRRFSMDEGGGIPLHTNRVEHEQYVLRGRALVRIGDEEHRVGPDDALYIPAGVPHAYRVEDGPFEFLCVVPNRPDEIRLLEEATDE